MISFKQFLVEDNIDDYESMVQTIKKDCAYYLSLTDELIYRGISNSNSTKNMINKLQVRTDRQPRDSSNALHLVLNSYLKEKFGHPYRTNSLFVTGKKSIAQGYMNHKDKIGDLCIIFPIGKFDFCYSKELIDVSWHFEAEYLDHFKSEFISNYPELGNNVLKSPEYLNELKKFIYSIADKEIDYVENGDIEDAIGRNREIMIKCNEYYAIPIEIKNFTLRGMPDDYDFRKLSKDLKK